MKPLTFLTAAVLYSLLTVSCSSLAVRQYRGRELGPIATEDVAREVATGVFLQCFGSSVLNEGPFVVRTEERAGDRVWIVSGTQPASTRGGVPRIEVTEGDGRILSLTRGP